MAATEDYLPICSTAYHIGYNHSFAQSSFVESSLVAGRTEVWLYEPSWLSADSVAKISTVVEDELAETVVIMMIMIS